MFRPYVGMEVTISIQRRDDLLEVESGLRGTDMDFPESLEFRRALWGWSHRKRLEKTA